MNRDCTAKNSDSGRLPYCTTQVSNFSALFMLESFRMPYTSAWHGCDCGSIVTPVLDTSITYHLRSGEKPLEILVASLVFVQEGKSWVVFVRFHCYLLEFKHAE